MCGDETGRIVAGISIPCGADIQGRSVGCGERAVQHITSAVPCLLRLDHLVFPRVSEQRLGQPPPIDDGETLAQKKRRLAAAGRMRGVEQIAGNFLLRHRGSLGIGQLHFPDFFTIWISSGVRP